MLRYREGQMDQANHVCTLEDNIADHKLEDESITSRRLVSLQFGDQTTKQIHPVVRSRNKTDLTNMTMIYQIWYG